MTADVRTSILTGARRLLVGCLLMAASSAAVEVVLFNGATFSGEFVSHNDNFIVIKKNGSDVSIAKKMVARISGLPAGVVVTLPADTINTASAPIGAPAPRPSANVASFDVLPGMELEITLQSGAKFVGTVIQNDDRLINLQSANGSRVNVYKHVIARILDRTSGKSFIVPVASQDTPSAGPSNATNVLPAATSAASSPPASDSAPAARMAPINNVAQTPVAQPPAVPRETKDAPPLVERSATLSQRVDSAQTTPSRTHPPVVPLRDTLAKASRQETPPDTLLQRASSPALPAATASAASVVPVSSAVAAPPAAAKPVQAPAPHKRSDGKTELLLKNGTSFIGTIASENDRVIVLSTSDGAVINIIKRLVKAIDGVPYTPAPSTGLLDSAFRPQQSALRETRRETAPDPREAATAGSVSVLPFVDLKGGVSASELTDSLTAATPVMRSAAARQLGAMGQWAVSAIPRLVALLADTALSSEALPLEIDSASIQKLLAPGFEAGRSLARMGEKGVDALKKNARSPDPVVREHAVFGLACVPGAASLGELRLALKDAEAGVRISALWGMRTPDAVTDLCGALNDRDGDVRTYAAASLYTLADPRSTSALIDALKDLRPLTRVFAARSLGKIRAAAATPPLIAALNDASPQVRSAAAGALGAIADTAAVNALCVAVKDNHPDVRKDACSALGSIRDPRAIPTLYTAMQEERDATVRPEVERALKRHTEIPQLIAALDEPHPVVRENAVYILWLMTGKDIGPDKQAWTDWLARENAAAKKTVPDSAMQKTVPAKNDRRK